MVLFTWILNHDVYIFGGRSRCTWQANNKEPKGCTVTFSKFKNLSAALGSKLLFVGLLLERLSGISVGV